MATTLKAKRSSTSRSASPRQSVVLTKGDWLDVMDHDGVWNVARVLSVPSPEEVEVMYDGWPEEYDEVVRVDSDRVAPYHTFTWAVKCWVKYLNWPMWPSVITIRTPGTMEGIENLAMENRLYVDFLDSSNFAKRDRCWQKKRHVKTFDDNFDKNRMGTNGAQFEQAMEYVLRSDSTTKMPTFAKGTLPFQYEFSTTESVEKMRKNMGNRLWYRNFSNNKGRHKLTHIYVDDSEDLATDESILVPKLKVRRPIMSATTDKRARTHKKKRSNPAKKQPVAVKIEQDPLAEVGVFGELGEMDSNEIATNDQEVERERDAAFKKRRRLQARKRSVLSPTVSKGVFKRGNHFSPSQDTNAAPTMPRHVTVMLDEIIVDDDDDSESGGIDRRKVARTSSRKSRAGSTPDRVKEESGGADSYNPLSLSDSKISVDIDTAQSSHKATKKAKKVGHVRERVRHRNSKESSNLHRKAWNGIFSDRAESATITTITTIKRSKRNDSYFSPSDGECGDTGYSDGYDPGTTSEDKAASPFGSQDIAMESRAGAQIRSGVRLKAIAACKQTSRDLTFSPGLAEKSSDDIEQTKMTARRSVPPLKGDLSLVSSPKPTSSIRSSRSLSDEDDWEDEEKGVLGDAVKKVGQCELPPKNPGKFGSSKQDAKSGAVAGPQTPRKSNSSRRPKTPIPLIEQRIAFAKEVLRDLDKEKQEATKLSTPKKRQKRSSTSSISESHSGKQTNAKTRTRSHQPESSDLSFLQSDNKETRPSVSSALAGDHEGNLMELDLSLHSNQQGHSFLSVVDAYTSDSQESKGIPTPFDEDVGIDIQSDPKEVKRAKRAEAKSVAKETIGTGAKQVGEEKLNDDDDDEEKSQEVRRHFCVMHAGLEGTLEIDEDEKVEMKPSKRTWISVPRKFELVKEAPHPDSGDHSNVALTSPSTVVFSSSEGFSMEKWLKRRQAARYRGSKT